MLGRLEQGAGFSRFSEGSRPVGKIETFKMIFPVIYFIKCLFFWFPPSRTAGTIHSQVKGWEFKSNECKWS